MFTNTRGERGREGKSERVTKKNTPKALADLIKTVSLAQTVRRENISLSKL